MSCDCGCECCAEEREPTAAEIELAKARAEFRLIERMTPARSQADALNKDIERHAERMENQLSAALFGAPVGAASGDLLGLSAWVSREAS